MATNYKKGDASLITLKSLVDKLGIVGKVKKPINKSDFVERRFIKLKDLNVDEKYQRLINKTMIKKTMSFDTTLFQDIWVFERPDGSIVINDGQHKGVLAYLLVSDSDDFEVPCKVQKHPSHFSVEDCVKQESSSFLGFNTNRTNVGALAQLRSNIASGCPDAIKEEQTYIDLGIRFENIGDLEGPEVIGYTKLKESLKVYGFLPVKQAIDYYYDILQKTKNKPEDCSWNTSKSKWTDETLKGSMIGTLAAIFYLRSFLSVNTSKRTGIDNFLDGRWVTRTSVKELMDKTDGNFQFVLGARRIMNNMRTLITADVFDGSVIGEATLRNYGLGDPSSIE